MAASEYAALSSGSLSAGSFFVSSNADCQRWLRLPVLTSERSSAGVLRSTAREPKSQKTKTAMPTTNAGIRKNWTSSRPAGVADARESGEEEEEEAEDSSNGAWGGAAGGVRSVMARLGARQAALRATREISEKGKMGERHLGARRSRTRTGPSSLSKKSSLLFSFLDSKHGQV